MCNDIYLFFFKWLLPCLHGWKIKLLKVAGAISSACSFFARKNFSAVWRDPNMLITSYWFLRCYYHGFRFSLCRTTHFPPKSAPSRIMTLAFFSHSKSLSIVLIDTLRTNAISCADIVGFGLNKDKIFFLRSFALFIVDSAKSLFSPTSFPTLTTLTTFAFCWKSLMFFPCNYITQSAYTSQKVSRQGNGHTKIW